MRSPYINTGFLVFLLVIATPRALAAATEPSIARADLMDTHGKKVGTATLVQTEKGVIMSLEASNLPSGEHGIHFHEAGKCEFPTFKSAGDHLHLKGTLHGLENPKGPHAGDLPNIQVKDDGTVKTELTTPRITVEPGPASILRKDGSTLIIHAKRDDQKSQPSGDSGDRIACGVIERATLGGSP
jgi:superoxide dismutase, Cu-Zn family